MRRLLLLNVWVAVAVLAGSSLGSASETAPAEWVDDLTPIASQDWNDARAAHLLERAGFGGTPAEIEHLAAMSPSDAVDYLVDYESIDAGLLPPFDPSNIWDEAMLGDADRNLDFGQALRKAYREGQVYGRKPAQGGTRPYQEIINTLYTKYFTSNREWDRVVLWWANRMLTTPRPLEEKMTLFWHGHFATEELKLDDYRLMLHQNQTLRRLATGSFRDLLVAISQDPAMLVYLDNRTNVKGQANENYAREIMELFALGVGNYTEDDIKQAARALTGWRNEGLRFVNDPALHDDGEKTIFGKTGNFNGYDVIGLILEKPVCAEFIAAKIYRNLVREEISPRLNTDLAAVLRQNNYGLKPLLKTIFLSRDFYSPLSCGTQIEGPVHYYVSACRKLGLDRIPGTPYFTPAMASLGQNLGNPPNVKGWDGGRAWINPSTLLQRGNLMRHLLFPDEAADLYPRYVIPDRYRFAKAEAEERDLMAARQVAAGEKELESAKAEVKSGVQAPAAKLINSRPDYDLKLGVYTAYVRAYERLKPVPPVAAQLSLTAMVRSSGAATAADAVDYFIRRFLRVGPSESDRQTLVSFMEELSGGKTVDYESPDVERHLRELLHSIMSLPEFQLG
jgi:uncharacterized protein (DUF1800 family)